MMNENIDLTKILKDCPVGTTLYSVDNGYVEFLRVDTEIGIYHIVVKIKYTGALDYYTKEGKANNFNDSECCLFPSKDQRDWSKFTAPWLKKERDTISETDGYKFDDQIKNDNLRIIVPKSIWISVKEKLPYNNPNFIHFGFTNKVLVREKNGNVFVAYMKKNKDNEWIWCNDMDDNFNLLSDITHWMHIPEAPKE